MANPLVSEPNVPEPTKTHFANLGFEVQFELDSAELETRFLKRSARIHPDRASGDEKVRIQAVMQSALVNEAYAVLKDPFRRAEYLLSLEGGPTASEDKRTPSGFLEAMLDKRDELEQVLGGDDPERTEVFRRELEAELATLRIGLEQEFASNKEGPERFVALRETLNISAYYRGLLRDLKEGH